MIQKRKATSAHRQDIWLKDLIDEHLEGTMTSRGEHVFYPSVISNSCDRYVWLCYNGRMVDRPLPAVLERIFQNGSFLEERVGKWFSELGILIDREVSVKYEIPAISGRIDFLIRHANFGVIPIELKSINTSKFDTLRKPLPEHNIQIQMYLNMGNYAKGTVLYENKNNQKIKAFLVDKDPEHWADILERCFKIKDMLAMPEKCTGPRYCDCRLVEEGLL
jgi:hypothetical protein